VCRRDARNIVGHVNTPTTSGLNAGAFALIAPTVSSFGSKIVRFAASPQSLPSGLRRVRAAANCGGQRAGGEIPVIIRPRRAARYGARVSAATDLRRVSATRYVTPLREGGSLPGLVEADDSGLYVTKFRGAGQGTLALVAEVIVGELAVVPE
jgi:hypothetical protein